jgi:RimJ/RimL family protein N-acetyltransferase
VKIEFCRCTEPSASQLATLARWENDGAIRHLHVYSPDRESYERLASEADLLRKHRSEARYWLVHADGEPVGEVSCHLDPPHLHEPVEGTAWLGVVIGESSCWGKGIGRAAMQFVEERARSAGARRIEIGVFAYNERAVRLYERLGYRRFATIPDFTYWRGHMWADIRMEKRLT